MKRTGTADLPLHGGRAPRWLTRRMGRLARAITVHIAEEFGPDEVLKRLSDPFWFQAFGCVLGFDWHSSGVTTTVCGALKTSLAGTERELGIYVCGGKGGRGRKTPQEIDSHALSVSVDGSRLVKSSRMAAKVDSAAVQDGHEIYHHAFFFTPSGAWAVVQQGMRPESKTARRYHWLGEKVKSFVEEPHAGVVADSREEVLNLVARESAPARDSSAELARQKPEEWLGEAAKMLAEGGRRLLMPERHRLGPGDLGSDRLKRILLSTYEREPKDFEELLGLKGVGAKTLRALALSAELIYETPASVKDPALYSFAHGGKDGYPYHVDRATYDATIELLGENIGKAKLASTERRDAMRRLARFSRMAGEARPEAP